MNELGKNGLEAEKARKANEGSEKEQKFPKPDDNDWDDDDDDWDDDDDDDWDDTPQRLRKNEHLFTPTILFPSQKVLHKNVPFLQSCSAAAYPRFYG